MTDMKKLMSGDAFIDAKVAQGIALEKLAEAALTPPIDLDPIDVSTLTNLRRVRASPGHACIAYRCDQGVLLRDRHTKLQYLLTPSHLGDMIPRDSEAR
jgi:hypothetical protein